MKTILSLYLVALLGFTAQAQDPELLDNNWYIDYIIVNGTTYESPVPAFPIVNTNINFFADNCDAVMDPDSDSFFSNITYDPVLDEFILFDWGITLPGCWLYCDFAAQYWELLTAGGATEITFSYTVSTNTDGTKGLLMTHANGNMAAYNNFPPLSISDQEKLNAIVYPNPASDIVNIVTDNVNIDSYQIYDLNGKVVFESSLLESSIDVSYLDQGVYFLEVSSKSAKGIYRILKN